MGNHFLAIVQQGLFTLQALLFRVVCVKKEIWSNVVFANSYRPCFKSRLHCIVQAVMSVTTENIEELVLLLGAAEWKEYASC